MQNRGRTSIQPRFAPVGDKALSVEFADAIDPTINAWVRALDRAIAVSDLPGIIETVPCFRSLMIVYEPEEIDFAGLCAALRTLLDGGLNARAASGRSWTVPVLYGAPTGSPLGDDLREVAEATGHTPDEVIGLHGSGDYQVYFVGFVPGLPVLGGLPAALHLPRRPEPRQGIPAGCVMIGGMQGLIAPMTLPSGWYALGFTPLRPYAPGSENPFLFRAGDRVRFRPATARECVKLAGVPAERFLDRQPPERHPLDRHPLDRDP